MWYADGASEMAQVYGKKAWRGFPHLSVSRLAPKQLSAKRVRRHVVVARSAAPKCARNRTSAGIPLQRRPEQTLMRRSDFVRIFKKCLSRRRSLNCVGSFNLLVEIKFTCK